MCKRIGVHNIVNIQYNPVTQYNQIHISHYSMQITKYVKLLRVEYSSPQYEHTVLRTLRLLMGILTVKAS
jgi:hypothetical protein